MKQVPMLDLKLEYEHMKGEIDSGTESSISSIAACALSPSGSLYRPHRACGQQSRIHSAP